MTWSILPEHAARIRAAIDAGPRADVPPAPAAWGSVSYEAEEQSERPYRLLADGTAIVSVTGALYSDSAPWWLVWVTDGTAYGQVVHRVTRAVEDTLVRRIVVDFDSPGGQVTGCAEAAAALRELAGRKAIVAYARGYCASAAYWLASQCGEVTASPTACVGSIGVVVHLYDSDRRLNLAGIDHYVVTNEGSPRKAPDISQESGRADVQRVCDQIAEAFYAAVAVGRGVDEAWVRESMGRGAVLVGSDAVEARLVDRLVVGPEAACDPPEEAEAVGTRDLVEDESPTPGAAGHHTPTEVIAMADKATPAAGRPTTDTEARERAAEIRALEAALAARDEALAQLQARVEQAEAKLAEQAEAERVKAREAMLDRHMAAGPILPADRDAWAADADAIGIEAVDRMLSRIHVTARPTQRMTADAVGAAPSSRAELAQFIQARAAEWGVSFTEAHSRLSVEAPHMFKETNT